MSCEHANGYTRYSQKGHGMGSLCLRSPTQEVTSDMKFTVHLAKAHLLSIERDITQPWKYSLNLTLWLQPIQLQSIRKADKETGDDIQTQSMLNASMIKDLQKDICTLKDNFDLLQGEAEEIAKCKANIMIKGLPDSNDHMAAVTKLLNLLAITKNPTYVRQVSDEPNSLLKVFFKLEPRLPPCIKTVHMMVYI